MSKSKVKVRHVVACNKHGVESKLWAGRMVVVSKPMNKRDANSGCPHCKAEEKQPE